jgi:hypothetical protein
MGRKSIMGGVRPKGFRRVQFDFEIDGVRFRPTLPWTPTAANLEQAQKLNARIKAQIEAGTFVFSDVFPKFKGLGKLPGSVSAKSCGEVFDDFLRHEQARVAREDLAPVTLKSHRQILDHVWRPALGTLPFLAVPYSMMVKVADSHSWNKKTYNNAISALRRAFAFGYLDYPDRVDPATRLRSAKIGKKDRPRIDPFSIQDAEVFIAAPLAAAPETSEGNPPCTPSRASCPPATSAEGQTDGFDRHIFACGADPCLPRIWDSMSETEVTQARDSDVQM